MSAAEKKRDPLIALRIPPALDARLRAEVAASGVTLSEFVRVALEARLDPPARKPARVAATPPTRSRSTGVCEHRVRVGAYCRQCDRVVP